MSESNKPTLSLHQNSTSNPQLTLNNGLTIPQIGLGVWQAKDGGEVEGAVLAALETGYRLIDTAAAYDNERGVGNAIRQSGIPRQEIFVTSKLWNDSHDRDSALQAFETSMDKLGLTYLDMYLIHWPVPADNKFVEAWQTLEELYNDGKIKAIGVCNFLPEHLETLMQTTKIVPAVNQIELHPRLQQHNTRDFCRQHDIAIESWSPIMQGGSLLDDSSLQAIAKKHHKSVAQIIIRWHLQHGFIVIPKSVHQQRISENYDVLDFALDEDDINKIDGMNNDERTGPDPRVANFK